MSIRSGVMLASAVGTYLNRYGVRCGRRAVVFTNNDAAYDAALALGRSKRHRGLRRRMARAMPCGDVPSGVSRQIESACSSGRSIPQHLLESHWISLGPQRIHYPFGNE